jgi:hypothetical protein
MGKKKFKADMGKSFVFFLKLSELIIFYLNHSNTHPKIRRVIVNTIHPRCVLEWYL